MNNSLVLGRTRRWIFCGRTRNRFESFVRSGQEWLLLVQEGQWNTDLVGEMENLLFEGLQLTQFMTVMKIFRFGRDDG